jgi:two-component sensor histidine kinase
MLNRAKRYEDAIISLESSLSIATSTFGDDFYLAAVYRELSRAYQGLGDYKKAFEALTSHHTYQDSVLTMEANERMAELQTLYETAQKERTITEQNAQLSRQNTIMYFVLGMLAIVGIGIFLLYKLNRQLENRNQEKDVLLKEIHHRVKNNLQILSSLLSLQSQYIKDEKALDAIQEGRNRVESMGLIHQKLFSADNITGVDMKDYVGQLCEYLKQSFSTDNKKIEVDHDIEIGLMDIDSAIPLGLIINELITNTRKYAVTKDNICRIMIKLWIDNEKILCLRVSDNGIASEKVATEYSSTSFGTDLVKILSKKLKGTVDITTDNGYQTLIKFRRYKLVDKSYSYASN